MKLDLDFGLDDHIRMKPLLLGPHLAFVKLHFDGAPPGRIVRLVVRGNVNSRAQRLQRAFHFVARSLQFIRAFSGAPITDNELGHIAATFPGVSITRCPG